MDVGECFRGDGVYAEESNAVRQGGELSGERAHVLPRTSGIEVGERDVAHGGIPYLSTHVWRPWFGPQGVKEGPYEGEVVHFSRVSLLRMLIEAVGLVAKLFCHSGIYIISFMDGCVDEVPDEGADFVRVPLERAVSLMRLEHFVADGIPGEGSS